MHARTLFAIVFAFLSHRKPCVLYAQGVRVQASVKSGTAERSLIAAFSPRSNLFGRSNPQFVANIVLFDRIQRGPVTAYRDGSTLILSGVKAHLISINDATRLVQLGPTNVEGFLSSDAPLSSASVNEWHLSRLSTFQDGRPLDGIWSYTSTSFCEGSSDTFLGGHCKLAGKTVHAAYLDLPTHNKLKVKARVHFFDKWEGESIYVKINGKIVWTRSWNWCPQRASQICARRGVDSCGHSYPDRLSVPVEIEQHHTGSALLMAFGSTMPKNADPCSASWGVDDVAIYLH